MDNFRTRGGSRPGLGLGVRTDLASTIRLLTKVSVLKATWPRSYSYLGGTQLRDAPVSLGWTGSPSYVQTDRVRDGVLRNSVDWGVGFPTFVPNINSTGPYELSIHITPNEETYDGQVYVYLGLPSADTDPTTVDCVRVTFTLQGNQYSASVVDISGGVPTGPETTSATLTDNPNTAGILAIYVNPAVGLVNVFWRNITLVSSQFGVSTGIYSSIEVTDESITANKLATEWTVNQATTTVYDDLRRDVLVAVASGDIWMEDTADSMRQITTDAPLNSSVDLVATDREQKLFIADFGIAVVGDMGVVAGEDYNELEASPKNFTAAGITTEYVLEITNSDYSQNEIQSVTVTGADGGTFRLSYKGLFTTPLAWNADAGVIKARLQALQTVDEVDVQAVMQGAEGEETAVPGSWTVEFKGTHEGANVDLLEADSTSLTASSEAVTVSVSIVTTQVSADGEFFLGQYEITAVDATKISFDPPLNVADGFSESVGSIEFQVVRAPKVFDPRRETLEAHRAEKGFVPGACRLVALYRDRIVYAGSDLLPHVWYMSRQGDPYDWDYSQEDDGAAIAAQNSVAGQLADPITALIAHGDECLIFGTYNSLWICRGDPGFGGTIDQLSRKIGIIGPHAWCRTPDDMCVFLSPDGLYVMPAGCAGFPQSLSRERLPDELLCLVAGREAVILEYDTVYRGVHIFATKRDGSESTHWWYDWEAKAFWKVKLQSGHNPYAVHERIAWSDCPVVLVAGNDGYIRYFDRMFHVDDGDSEIESYCDFGPFPLDDEDYVQGVLAELSAALGKDSGEVDWTVRVGNSAEEAYEATADASGTWSIKGLNNASNPRLRGASFVVRVANNRKRQWAVERITAEIRAAGKRRT